MTEQNFARNKVKICFPSSNGRQTLRHASSLLEVSVPLLCSVLETEPYARDHELAAIINNGICNWISRSKMTLTSSKSSSEPGMSLLVGKT